MALIAAIIGILALAAIANRMLRGIVSYWVYFCLLMPGIITHELSHVVGAIVTGADVFDIKLISKSGGEVRHGPPRLPFVGQFIISFAPLLIEGALSYAIIWHLFLSSGTSIWSAVGSWGLGDWLLLYALISLMLTFTPSKQDLRSGIWSLLFVVPILLFLIYNPSINIQPALLPAVLWLNVALVVFIAILTPFKLIATMRARH